MAYAKGTQVSQDRSRVEIERTLERYGATAFMYAWQGNAAAIGFDLHDRRIKIIVPMPDRADYAVTPSGRERCDSATSQAYDQAKRERWRVMLIAIKAKLEMVEVGITTLDQEFLPHIQLPDGRTIGELVLPQIDKAYKTGKLPKLLTASVG